jgi:hypothetical protein
LTDLKYGESWLLPVALSRAYCILARRWFALTEASGSVVPVRIDCARVHKTYSASRWLSIPPL